MADDDGPLAWIHWPTVAKALVAGAGIGLLLAVVMEDFFLGMTLGVVNGLGFALGRSFTRNR